MTRDDQIDRLIEQSRAHDIRPEGQLRPEFIATTLLVVLFISIELTVWMVAR